MGIFLLVLLSVTVEMVLMVLCDIDDGDDLSSGLAKPLVDDFKVVPKSDKVSEADGDVDDDDEAVFFFWLAFACSTMSFVLRRISCACAKSWV